MLLEKQASPHVPSMTDLAEIDLAPDDAGEPRAFRARNIAAVRLSSALVAHSSETIQALKTPGILDAEWQAREQPALMRVLAALRSSGTQVNSPSQLLVAAIEVLAGVMEDQLLASLTDDDCQRLVAARDKLIDFIGENENHLFVPLKDFIGNLIEKYEERFDVAILAENADPREVLLGLGPMGLDAAYSDDEPEYTDVTFIEKNPNYTGIRAELSNEEHSSGGEPAAAYGDDEPEYTDATFIKVNPNYGKK